MGDYGTTKIIGQLYQFVKGCLEIVDNKDEEMPRKKKQDTNKTEYSNSCSTASKDVNREQPSQQAMNNEPFRVC